MDLLVSVASLALVLGMLGGLLWWARRAGRREATSGRQIQVVETVPLRRDQFLHLVRLGDRGLLIASSARRCELLCELEAAPAENSPRVSSWAEMLRTHLKRA